MSKNKGKIDKLGKRIGLVCNATEDMFMIKKGSAIISLTAANPPMRVSSHSAGWTHKWSSLLGAEVLLDWNTDKLSEFSEVFIWNDINSKPGAMNLMGFKVDNEVGCKIQNRIDMVDAAYKNGVNFKQLDFKQTFQTCFEARKLKAYNWMDDIEAVEQVDIIYAKRVIGDSHSISIAPPDYSISRNDGKTLFGALGVGLAAFMTGDETEVIFKFFDIDVRHHVFRQEDPVKSVVDMLDEYERQVKEIIQSGVSVKVCHAMPSTPDSRVIPKTGYFKKEPFHGPLERRSSCITFFNEELDKRFGVDNTISYPDDYFVDGLLDTSKMEGGSNGRSFHLAPEFYIG